MGTEGGWAVNSGGKHLSAAKRGSTFVQHGMQTASDGDPGCVGVGWADHAFPISLGKLRNGRLNLVLLNPGVLETMLSRSFMWSVRMDR